MFLRMTVGWPAMRGPASARCTAPSCSEPSAARAPAVRPERCRKVRRSVKVGPTCVASEEVETDATGIAGCVARPTAPRLRLISIAPSLVERLVAIGAVIGLDVLGLAIPCPGLVIAGVVGLGLGRQHRRCGRCGGRRTDRAQEIAPV